VASAYHALLALHQERMDWTLDEAMAAVVREGSGIVVILHPRDNPLGMPNQLVQALATGGTLEALLGASSHGHPAAEPATVVLQRYGVGAQILHDLGVKHLRVLGRRRSMAALSGFGQEIVQWLETPPAAPHSMMP
jgi:3,4-dihydroxy 2-butanone 4-phosphate synthase/GTP cyclohydrolase II